MNKSIITCSSEHYNKTQITKKYTPGTRHHRNYKVQPKLLIGGYVVYSKLLSSGDLIWDPYKVVVHNTYLRLPALAFLSGNQIKLKCKFLQLITAKPGE